MKTHRGNILGRVKDKIADMADDAAHSSSLPLETESQYEEMDVPARPGRNAAETARERRNTPMETARGRTARHDWSGVSFGGRGIAAAIAVFFLLFILVLLVPSCAAMLSGPASDNPYGIVEKRVDDAFSSQ